MGREAWAQAEAVDQDESPGFLAGRRGQDVGQEGSFRQQHVGPMGKSDCRSALARSQPALKWSVVSEPGVRVSSRDRVKEESSKRHQGAVWRRGGEDQPCSWGKDAAQGSF